MLIEWEIHSMVIIFRSIRGFNGDYMGFNMGIQCGDFIVAIDFGWYTFRYIGIQPATQNYVFKMRLTNQNGDSPLMILLGIEWAYHRGLEPMIKYQFVGWCVVLLIFFARFLPFPWMTMNTNHQPLFSNRSVDTAQLGSHFPLDIICIGWSFHLEISLKWPSKLGTLEVVFFLERKPKDSWYE